MSPKAKDEEKAEPTTAELEQQRQDEVQAAVGDLHHVEEQAIHGITLVEGDKAEEG